MAGDQKLEKEDWGLADDLLDDPQDGEADDLLDDELVVNTLTDIMFILVDIHDQLEEDDTGQSFASRLLKFQPYTISKMPCTVYCHFEDRKL